MAKRKKFKPTKFSWKLIRGTVDGHPNAFNSLKRHIRYDNEGKDVLLAYLANEAYRLKRLPDSEVGDLMSEADKQIWVCATKFLNYKKEGKPQKIPFKTYFYNRLKQCITDRRKATVAGKDLENTRASSLNGMMESTGFDTPDEFDDPDLPLAIRDVVEKMDKREKMLAQRLMEGWSLSEIREDLVANLSSRKDRDEDTVKKFVDKAIKNSVELMRDLFGGISNA